MSLLRCMAAVVCMGPPTWNTEWALSGVEGEEDL